MIQVLFFLIGIIGIAMFYYGAKIILKKYRCTQAVSKLHFSEETNEVNFEKTGLYSICFIGATKVDNIGDFDINITEGEQELYIVEKGMKFNFLYNKKIGTECYQFEIETPGIHKIQFNNIQDLEFRESKVGAKSISPKRITSDNIEIIIRETSSNFTYIMSILLVVFGFNIAGWGIISAFNPQIIG